MKLTKTNSGNYAKEVKIGSDFESFASFATRQEAELRLTMYRAGECEIREFQASERIAKRLAGVSIGQIIYAVGAKKKQKTVMTHASAEECIAAGKTPGPCNL